jgi:hypothetical protein
MIMLLAVAGLSAPAQVVINEFAPANKGAVQDEDGDSPDWIELYNAGSNPADLAGWGLSDDSLKPFKWVFPAKLLQPGEFILVFASAKDRTSGTYLHTNFKLEKGEEPLLLTDPSGKVTDMHPCLCIPGDYSYGHYPDGGDNRFHFISCTPGASNNSSDYVQLENVKDSLGFSHAGGFYTGDVMLQLSAANPLSKIYYTLDGTLPGESSSLYSSALHVRNRTGEQGIAFIPTSPYWKTPKGDVFRGTVVRAAAYVSGCRVSDVYTQTYLIAPGISGRYTFPVVSITTDVDGFFSDHKGIYVVGHHGPGLENYHNKGEEWERDAHLEFYDAGGSLVLQQDLGIRIHGRGTRQGPQKSLRLYAKEKYGKPTFDHRFFPAKDISSFKRLILKTTHSSESNTLFKDELAAAITRSMNIDYQAYLPVVVFINGEYWGVHNLRERMDKYYIRDNHSVSPDSLDMLGLSLEGQEEVEGDAMIYNGLMSYIATHDMSDDEHYKEVERQIDITNFIDVHIAHLYLANYDWPRNNVRYWRERNADGTWRWMFFDCDFCMNETYNNHLVNYVNGEPRFEEATWLVRELMKNDKFRQLFTQRFFHHLNTTFEAGRMISLIDEFRQAYAPMVNEHVNRWGMPESYAAWESNVSDLENFALKRPLEMARQLVELYGNPYKVYPNPASTQVHIDMLSGDDLPLEVRIFNMQGQMISSVSYGASSQMEGQAIDISSLAPGMYVLRLQYGNLLFSDKLVVQ